MERNREHIKVILDVLITCAKQEVPLRGNRENDEVKNAGNSLEFYRLVCRHDKATQERLDVIPSNAKMLSHEIQNDLLDATCTLLLRRIKRELHEKSFYAILADECKDVYKKQLVAVCLRYVHMRTVRKRAVGLVAKDNMTAYAIAQKILEAVAPFELDPSLCVGFGFDGASVMPGHKGGVQAILKGTFQNAIYVQSLSYVKPHPVSCGPDIAGCFFPTLSTPCTPSCAAVNVMPVSLTHIERCGPIRSHWNWSEGVTPGGIQDRPQ